MSLEEQLGADVKQAMRDGNKVARDTLRMVLSDLKNKAVSLRGERGDGEVTLSEEEVQAVVLRAVKTRKESVREYEAAGRQELADIEHAEIAVIEGYLPKQLSPEETKAAVEELVKELGLSTMKDIGTLMKALKTKFGNTVDGKEAQQTARGLLS